MPADQPLLQCAALLLEVHVLAFAEEHERDQGDYGHRAQVPAKRLDAEVHDQGRRDGRGERAAGDGRQVIAQASSVASAGSDLATSVNKMSPK